MILRVAVLEQHRLDLRVFFKDADEFRAAIAAKTHNAN
jgi:hypothetical protein